MLRQIQSLQHPLVKHIVKIRQIRDYRYDQGTCIVEGMKLVHELCATSKPLAIFALREDLLPEKYNPETTFIVSEAVMDKASGLIHSEGILAEFPLPPFRALDDLKYILVLDGINDPGNLGTLIRTALAFNWEGIFLTHDSCDPFNEKAIRAAKGATFQLPIFHGTAQDLEQLIQKSGMPAVVADLEGTSFEELKFPNGVALILGNEAHGSSLSENQTFQKITIPMSGKIESLNVSIAGGILMQGLHSPLFTAKVKKNER